MFYQSFARVNLGCGLWKHKDAWLLYLEVHFIHVFVFMRKILAFFF